MRQLVVIVHLLAITALMFYVARRNNDLLKIFIPGILLKIGAGICLGLVYRYYYTIGDTFGYLHDGTTFANIFFDSPVEYVRVLITPHTAWPALELTLNEPRAIFLSKLVSILALCTNNNYWLISTYLSIVSFFGCWYLVRTILKVYPRVFASAIISFLFIPSFLFWSSGVIKESLAVASLTFLAAIFLRLWVKEKIQWYTWLLTAFAVWMGWQLKYYYAAVLLVVIITALTYRFLIQPKIRSISFYVHALVWICLFSLPLIVVASLHPNFYPHRFFKVIFDNYVAFQTLSAPGDAVTFFHMAPDASILVNAPWALLSGLFRPFIWEARTTFQFCVAIENLILLLLFLASVRYWKNQASMDTRLLLFAVIVYVTVLCVMLTLSTPNFGTLSRYRTAFQPFFILIVLSSSPAVDGFLQRTIARLVQTKP